MMLPVTIILDCGLPLDVDAECMHNGTHWELLEAYERYGDRCYDLSDNERDQIEVEVNLEDDEAAWTDDWEEPVDDDCEVGQPSYL